MLKRCYSAFVTAIRTLTCLDVPGRDAAGIADGLSFFPAAGFIIGAIVAAAVAGFHALFDWELGAGVLGATLCVLLTRALHTDGLADSIDGLLGGRTRERKLEIMKDTHVGAFGVTAIALSLLLKTAALARLAGSGWQWWWIPVPFIVSRAVLVKLAVVLPYARSEGGTGAVFVNNASRRHLVAALLSGLILCFALAGIGGVIAMLAAQLFAMFLAGRLNRALGGVTGDLLGMANELVETGLLLAIAALSPYLVHLDWRAIISHWA